MKEQKYFLQEQPPQKERPKNLPDNARALNDSVDWWVVGGEEDDYLPTGKRQYYFADGYLFLEVVLEEGRVIEQKFFPPNGVPKNAEWLEGIQSANSVYYENCWIVIDKQFLEKYGYYYIECYTIKGEKFRLLKFNKNDELIIDAHLKIADIPENAVWSNDWYEEWRAGETNDKGQKVGKWVSYNEFGDIEFEAEYSQKGIRISKTIYKEGGEPNKYYFYDKKGELERIEYYRKVASCEQYYPFSEGALAKKAYKIVEDSKGKLTFYDEYDELLKRTKRKKTWKKYLKPVANETAIEAYNRYITLLETLKKEHAENEDERDEIDYYKPTILKRFTLDEIKDIEKEMGFIFPPSYTEFVTQIGAFEFGRGINSECSMFIYDSLDTTRSFKEKLDYEWDYDISVLSKEEQTLMNKVVPFSYGDESLQAVYYYCFNYNTLNTETGEVEVYNLDQDDIYRLHHELNTKPTKTRGFDVHIQDVIQQEIEYFLDSYEMYE